MALELMSWRLQQLRSEGSENPAQVLSTARNAIRRVRMVMRGLPQRELTEEGKRLIGVVCLTMALRAWRKYPHTNAVCIL
jgi:hypothetical protein